MFCVSPSCTATSWLVSVEAAARPPCRWRRRSARRLSPSTRITLARGRRPRTPARRGTSPSELSRRTGTAAAPRLPPNSAHSIAPKIELLPAPLGPAIEYEAGRVEVELELGEGAEVLALEVQQLHAPISSAALAHERLGAGDELPRLDAAGHARGEKVAQLLRGARARPVRAGVDEAAGRARSAGSSVNAAAIARRSIAP